MRSLAFAFGAGLLAPVNPCGFAMLPAFIGYYLGDGQRAEGSSLARLTRGFAVGATVSAGFVGAFGVAALLVAVGLRSLVHYVPWAAALIGLLLVGLGVAIVAGRPLTLRPTKGLRPGEGRAYRRMALFGVAYATASMSCQLAIVLVVVSQALAAPHLTGMAGVLGAYGAGAATVLSAVAVSLALAREALTLRLRRILPWVERIGGFLLVASGLYLLAYWLPILAGSTHSPVASWGGSLAGRIANVLDANQGRFAVLAVVLLALAAALAAWRWRRRPVVTASEPFTQVGPPGPAEDCCSPLSDTPGRQDEDVPVS